MTVDLAWPASLPLPTMVGYGIEDDLRVERSEMESGSSRERPTSTSITSSIQARWEFTLYQYAIFEAWLIHRARGRWFSMTYLGGIGLVECEARIQKGKAPSKFQNGARVTITATIDIRDRPMLNDEDLTLLIDEDDGELFAAIQTLHDFMSAGFWA